MRRGVRAVGDARGCRDGSAPAPPVELNSERWAIYRLRDEERSNRQSITTRGASAALDGPIAGGDWGGGADVAGGRGGFVSEAVVPTPVTRRDCFLARA